VRAGRAVKRVGLATAGAVVAALAGCASSPPVPQWKDPEPAVSDAVAAPEPGPEPSSVAAVVASGQRFLDAVRGRLPEVAMDRRNEEITEMGGQACASLAAGHPRRKVAAELGEYGLPDADARELISLARSTLCRS
jgi:hypothetical protein